MKNSLLWILLCFIASALVACSAKTLRDCTPAQHPAPSAQPASYDGTFTNFGGATLVIRNYVAAQGFDFELEIRSDDACDSVNYTGAVKFTETQTAKSVREDVFRLQSGAVQFEPAVEMIGMSCARVIKVDFTRLK